MTKFTLLVFVFGILGCDLSFQLPSLESRIIGGQDAKIQEVPYQLSLFHFSEFIGGASIVSNKYAITAAHCVKGLNSKNLRVGAGHEAKSRGAFYNILQVIVHENYNTKSADNDIAIIQIDGTFLFGVNVKAVGLPDSEAEPPVGLKVTISGWGATKMQASRLLSAEFSEKLQKATVSIIDRKVCKKNYSKVRPVSKNMICAGDVHKDACLNDSGGPMVANNKLYGIVSWGKGCGDSKYPGVYTHVAKYRAWIKKKANI